MKFQMRTAYIATLLALGSTANAERMIVTFDNASSKSIGLKSGHQVLAQGNNWFAVDLDKKSKMSMKSINGFKSMEVDAKRYPYALYNDDPGDPTLQQLTPYAIYQSQANQLTLQSGQKVCIIDSGLDASNNDFNWNVITGDNDSGTGNWNVQGGPHGTHVAGTVAAADNGFGVIGTAPGVPLHIIKVFNETGWGYSSDLAQAASLCTQAGANIITMSLGGGAANTTEENAFNTFTNNGGLVLAAAGNDGNNVRSFPAGYKSIMMIGANDGDNNIASFSQYPTNVKNGVTDDGFGVEVTAGGVATLSTYPAGLATLASLTVDSAGLATSAMENLGSATANTYFMGTGEATDSAANGKVCVIDRGNISFHDKVLNCENSGGVGAILVNNVSGVLAATLGTTNSTTIPAVGAALEDRTAIVNSSSATINIGASDYGYLSGTSMATPAVAGLSALVWSNNPNCTGADIRAALKATAQDQGAAGRDDNFGYGIAKGKAASDYLATQACGGGGTANVAPVASFTQSCSGLTCSFNGSGSSDSDGSIVGYSWSIGGTGSTASKTYSGYGTYSVTLTVTDDGGATGSSTQSVVLTDPNQSILTNGVAKTGLSAAKNAEQNWTMSVPSGATNLAFNMSGGTGDADMYVRFGAAPTTATYDCRPYASGNSEACPIATAQAGTYYVMIRAYAAYSGVSLVGSYDTPAANVAPTASFTSSCTDLSCSFNASSSSDSDGTISSYSWSFGGTGVTASNTYASAGTYSVTLTVTDNNGATNSTTSSVTVTAPPANVAPIASFTSSCTDLTCSFNASGSSDSDGSISSYSWSFGGTGVTASNTYGSAGTYSVTLTVTDNNGATATSTSSVTVTAPPVVGNVLSNGVTVPGLAAATGAEILYTMDVPAGATNISFAISGGTGDADMYVRFGAAPTDTNYDCRPYVGGNNETCTGTSTGGTYYIRVKAYSAYSGVSLVGNYTAAGSGPTPIDSTTSNISVATNAWKRYTLNLGSGYSTLSFTMSGGTGDADLYVTNGSQSTTSAYDCRPYKSGNNEVCTFNAPASGTWYIDIRGYSAASGVSLRTQAN